MRKYIILLLLIVGCATYPVDERHQNTGYGGTVIDETLYQATRLKKPSVWLKYESHAYLLQEIEEKLKTGMMPGEEFQKSKAALPVGGRIIIRVESASIDGANTEWFTIYLEKNGQQIRKIQGRKNIANMPANPYDYWWNLMLVSLDEPIKYPLTVKIYNRLFEETYQFKIIPDDSK